jgi:hypothetical protein
LALNPSTEANQWARQIFSQAWKKQSQPQHRENYNGENSADLIGANNPCSRKRNNARDRSEGGRHTNQKRESTSTKRLVGTRKDERQNWQDARTDYGQNTANESQKVQKHHVPASPVH